MPILIDGSHRAALALRERRPFYAYQLSEKEQYSICTYTPAGGEPGPMLKVEDVVGQQAEEAVRPSSLPQRGWREFRDGYVSLYLGNQAFDIRVDALVLGALLLIAIISYAITGALIVSLVLLVVVAVYAFVGSIG